MSQVNGQDGISSFQGPKFQKHGVWGQSDTGDGVVGTTDSGFGVSGFSEYNYGVVAGSFAVGLYASSIDSFGLMAEGGNVGIYAHNFTANGHDAYLSSLDGAGEFYGDVNIHGNIHMYTAVSQIDHPLDPANKYLSHSSVESADMKNIYDGVATLDNKGKAEVELPDWFQALNKDFRYQLTPIGSAGPNLYIQQGITKNHFKIAGGTQGMKVSWQVTGIRKDPWANANRVKVEENKPKKERGYYLNPHLYKKSQEKGIMWARHPEHDKIGRDAMKKTKELLKNIPKAPERTRRTQKMTK